MENQSCINIYGLRGNKNILNGVYKQFGFYNLRPRFKDPHGCLINWSSGYWYAINTAFGVSISVESTEYYPPYSGWSDGAIVGECVDPVYQCLNVTGSITNPVLNGDYLVQQDYYYNGRPVWVKDSGDVNSCSIIYGTASEGCPVDGWYSIMGNSLYAMSGVTFIYIASTDLIPPLGNWSEGDVSANCVAN